MPTSPLPDRPDTDPPVPRWRFIAAGVVLVLLIGAGAVWLLRPESTDCADGVKRIRTGDATRCVGLTDGAYPFDKGLRTLFEKVEQENKKVAEWAADPHGDPYVSVVYLANMSPATGDSQNAKSVLHELEGAYTAQIEANGDPRKGHRPQIKLLLGDMGSQDKHLDYTLDQIKARLKKDHIVAVAGLGPSGKGTKAMVKKLSDLNIASFGSALTADDLENSHGLVRVAPPNANEAAAAVQFLTSKPYSKAKVLIVKDVKERDSYTDTLSEKFGDRLPEERKVDGEPMEYDSSKGGLATYFENQNNNLCANGPDVVYFAGRGRDLPYFLESLAKRNCSHSSLMVLSGDDTSQVFQADGFKNVKDSLEKGKIRLVYTGLAHPGAWTKAEDFFDRNATRPFRDRGDFTNIFGNEKNENLEDGQAIMGYDAVCAAVKAIKLTAPLDNVQRKRVMLQLKGLNGTNAVHGASGYISVQNNGSPEDKAIPLIEIKKDGSTTTLDVVSGSGKGAPYTLPK
ncbi:ABC transporter substrate-binding protein [Streptomyces sp. NPDC096080]|uniref:ABC transporter substrate-binding protein n=1 Tax=Streptomyces sp. NPDC096080 TaxID=3156693 RepID=UPI00331B7609